jgi:cell division septum initiation protein DivIVA
MESQAELVRLQDFVDLLHKEIDQLHRDKERLAEPVEHLKGENASLASAATRCKAGAIPASGSKEGHRGR